MGVKIKQAVWTINPAREERLNEMCGKLAINPIIATMLINRGIDTVEKAGSFLNVSIENLHPPTMMSGMKTATDRICQAVQNGESIVIYGDYDVDGISSTALLVSFLDDIGTDVSYYIPHRIEEGYGLNMDAIKKLADQKFSLMITVDCGITSVEEIREASRLGVDVIITDHHQVSSPLPAATAVLNPALESCEYPFKSLAGVGIAFKLLTALKDALIEKKIIKEKEAPNLRRKLDLVALGTLADMVPLVGENHMLVRFGLEEMSATKNAGLRSLINLGNMGSRRISATDVGFFLAPRLNAIGRLQNARLGVELLTTKDRRRAKEIARILDEENRKRQTIQARIFQEVLDCIDKEVDLQNDKAIILASKGWHPGVIGIVASKVVERFNLPTILLNIENGTCRGSARSIPNFHIYNGLQTCKDKLLHFGGHKYAAGLSLNRSRVEEFKKAFLMITAEQLSPATCAPPLKIDAEIRLDAITLDFVEEISELGPFGPSNPHPVFLAKEVWFLDKPAFIGRNGEHVRFEVGCNGSHVDGIGFGMASLFETLDTAKGAFDIVFTPNINTRGKFSNSVQLRLHDLRPSV